MSHFSTLCDHHKALLNRTIRYRNDTYLEYTTPSRHDTSYYFTLLNQSITLAKRNIIDPHYTAPHHNRASPDRTIPIRTRTLHYHTKALCKGTIRYLNTTLQSNTTLYRSITSTVLGFTQPEQNAIVHSLHHKASTELPLTRPSETGTTPYITGRYNMLLYLTNTLRY